MINHTRTLLMNIDGHLPVPDWAKGEELVDPGYRAVNVPTFVDEVRSRLFGSDPDRAMLNYRLAQYMPMLHATELVSYVTRMDRRITYVNTVRTDLTASDFFTPVVEPIVVGTTQITVIGQPPVPDITGKMRHEYVVELLDASTANVVERAPHYNVTQFTLTGESLPLGKSGYFVTLAGTHTPGTSYRVSFNARPTWELGDIVETFNEIGEPTLLGLFGLGRVAPYETYRNLFYTRRELPYRLGAVLMAVAQRTDEARGKANG